MQANAVTTNAQRLIETQLKGRTLRALVFASRKQGSSWQAIADEVFALTGEAVSRESLRAWFPDAPRARRPSVTA